MTITALKFATPSEQYVDWGNNMNFIFMRGQNLPPPLNNMDQNSPPPEGSKFATPYEQYVDWGNNINFIFIRDQTATPYEQYVDWGNNINLIFIST